MMLACNSPNPCTVPHTAGSASRNVPPATPHVADPQPNPGASATPEYAGAVPGPTPAEASRMQRSGHRAPPPTLGADSVDPEPRLANEPAGPTAQPTPAEIPLDDRAAQIEERSVGVLVPDPDAG